MEEVHLRLEDVIRVQWEKEAEARIQKTPFLIRKMARSLVEEMVTSEGRDLVTAEDIGRAKRHFLNRMGVQDQGKDDDFSDADIERVVQTAGAASQLDECNTRFHKIKLCGGAKGCPFSLFDTRRLALGLHRTMVEAGLDEVIAGGHNGPVLQHHTFKAAVAGCPNACSQPQIVDFAVICQQRPALLKPELCTGCGACADVCREQAIDTSQGSPEINDLCLHCGQCIATCPTTSLRAAEEGFQVLIGGRLGRHPALAQPLKDLATEEDVYAILKRSIRIYGEQRRRGERFSAMAQRLGFDRVTDAILRG